MSRNGLIAFVVFCATFVLFFLGVAFLASDNPSEQQVVGTACVKAGGSFHYDEDTGNYQCIARDGHVSSWTN